jgi:hypothetical protein
VGRNDEVGLDLGRSSLLGRVVATKLDLGRVAVVVPDLGLMSLLGQDGAARRLCEQATRGGSRCATGSSLLERIKGDARQIRPGHRSEHAAY